MEKINPQEVFKHITNLSDSVLYEDRINYITTTLEKQGLKPKQQETLSQQDTNSPFYYIQTLPNKWQKNKDQIAKNIVVVVPGKTDKIQTWVAHNDTTQGFEILLNLSKKNKSKKKKAQYGANDNASGCSILIEDIKNSLAKKPQNTQNYLFSGLEEGIKKRSMLYGFLGGIGLMSIVGASLLTVNQLTYSFSFTELAKNLFYGSYNGLLLLPIPFLFTNFKPLSRFRVGVIGSKHYADSLEKKILENIDSSVSVDMLAGEDYIIPKSCIGMEPLRWIFPRKSDKNLNQIIKDCIYELDGNFTEYSPGTSDNISFHEKGVPSSAIFTNLDNFLTDIHTTKDNPQNINLKTLAKSCEIISLLKRRLSGERKKDLKKNGDLAKLFQDKKTKEKYVILTNTEKTIPLNQLYKVEQENGKYVIQNFINWTADLDTKQLRKTNELNLSKLRLEEFVIVDNKHRETTYKRNNLSDRFKSNFTKTYGLFQGKLAEYFIPSLLGIYTSMGITTGTILGGLGLIESLALFPINLAIATIALKDYKNLTTEAYQHKLKGVTEKMYKPLLNIDEN